MQRASLTNCYLGYRSLGGLRNNSKPSQQKEPEGVALWLPKSRHPTLEVPTNQKGMSAMSYSTNPYAPRARREAINLVLVHGYTAAAAARKTGVHRSTIGRWLARPEANDQRKLLPTRSSRPRSHPATIPTTVIRRILELRWQLKRCAEVIHAMLRREGVRVSLATVGRVLARHAQTTSLYGRKGKKAWQRTPRPGALSNSSGRWVLPSAVFALARRTTTPTLSVLTARSKTSVWGAGQLSPASRDA